MSSIVFDRLVNIDPNETYESEQEIEEENYNFNEINVTSKNYLVHLYKNFKTCHNWLQSLIAAEKLDYIIISLLKNNLYSFSFKKFTEESPRDLLYFQGQEQFILKYIDDEELPPILCSFIEKYWLENIFHNGCIVAEIRDYRQSHSTTNFFNSSFILLKPTSLSLFYDVQKIVNLTKDHINWHPSTQFKLESKLIYLTSPKLCLDPNPCVGLLSKKLSGRKKLIFCNNIFSRLPRKRLKRAFNENSYPKEFKLLNFLNTRKVVPSPKIRSAANDIQPIDHEFIELFKNIQLLANDLTNSKETEDWNKLEKLEVYTVEYNDNSAARLIIFNAALSDTFYGSFIGNKSENYQNYQGWPQFKLGDIETKTKFVQDFCEHVAENLQKATKISIQIKNEPLKVRYLSGQESASPTNTLKPNHKKQTQSTSNNCKKKLKCSKQTTI